ncbi:MAG: type II and III secretion system protein [Verrucomicrobiaceae bacterium]
MKTFLKPTQAVLSVQDVNIKLHALLSDSQTKTVSYPRVVTTNNREVVLRSVINQPVLGGQASSSLSGGNTTTSAISYLPIGTVINILPKKMHENKVSLNIAIVISSIIGTTVIQGNPYPIASSRVYGAPVEVDSGYTIAIGGLDEAKESVDDQGIPVLNKIPVLGWLFKTRSKEKNHKNLMIFITPSLIDGQGGGLPDMPQTVLPRKPEPMMPHVPRIGADGRLVGGIAALPNAVAFMTRASNEIGQIITENRGTKEEWDKIKDLQASLSRLDKVVDRYMMEDPQRMEELKGYKWQIGKISDDVTRERLALIKKGYY